MTWVLLKAWLKKYWKWLLLPLGILVYIAGYRSKPEVVAPASVEAERVRQEADKQRALEESKAKVERDRRLVEVQVEHEKAISKLTQEQMDEASDLMIDPDKLNEYLKNVGRKVRD